MGLSSGTYAAPAWSPRGSVIEKLPDVKSSGCAAAGFASSAAATRAVSRPDTASDAVVLHHPTMDDPPCGVLPAGRLPGNAPWPAGGRDLPHGVFSRARR